MPASITKSAVSEELICKMVRKAFGGSVKDILELKEGCFNAAYKVGLEDRDVILKIAPPEEVEVATYEKGIMSSEVASMKMAKAVTRVPVPEILFYDRSGEVLDREYFFMEMLPGCSFASVKEQMPGQEKEYIYDQIGKYTKMLNGIEGRQFGYYGQPQKQGGNWYEVFQSMISDAFFDAQRKKIRIPVEQETVFRQLEKRREIFEAVKTPRFVHWDIWEGNVFVEKGKVTGIIDFERCLWADRLMEEGFRTYAYKKAFFDGYGIGELTEEERIRVRWYDVYLFLLSCLECEYRQYESMWLYEWGCSMLQKYFS